MIALTPFTVGAHHLALTLVAKEGGSASNGWTQEHKDDAKSKAVSTRLLVPFQQPTAGYQTQLKVKRKFLVRTRGLFFIIFKLLSTLH